jgi:SAM-dependent methyltransferase
VRPADYYLKTDDRSSDWAERAGEQGFAPVGSVIEAALPFVSSGKRILDIGCQGGHQLALLRDRFDEAYGLDIAPYTDMWSYFSDISFLVHDVDAERIPFPDAYFDTIIATNVLEHVFDVFGFVSEISRLLRKGGTCLISVPNVAEIRRVASIIRGRVPVTGGDQYPFTPEQGWDGQHLHYFTPSAISSLLSSHDLKIAETLVIGRFPKIKRVWLSGLSSSIDIVAVRV